MSEPTKQDVPVWSEWGDEQWVKDAEPESYQDANGIIWHREKLPRREMGSSWWQARFDDYVVIAHERELRREWNMREKGEFDPDPCKTLSELLEGVQVNIGLRQQGHMETVAAMRSEGKSWNEIGKQIGWAGSAVEEWYAMESQAQASEEKPEPPQFKNDIASRLIWKLTEFLIAALPSEESIQVGETPVDCAIRVIGSRLAPPPAPREEVELPPHGCEYCLSQETDHKHANGRRCCGDCCAAHGGLTVDRYAYDWISRIIDAHNQYEDSLLTAMHSALSAPTLEAARKILSEALDIQ